MTGVGSVAEREVRLELVQQAPVECVQIQRRLGDLGAHSPILWARSVRKMPLGLSAGRRVTRAKVWVS